MRNILYGATAVIAMSASLSNAKVPVHINSGNPAFPFPQFLHYEYGKSHSLKNLGTDNPEGVVHIEMEQDIRDAYQIFANEWKYTGDSWDGVQYILGNIGCPYDCREGDGYSMLAAAVMGDKESFDGLWFRIHDQFRPGSQSYATGATIPGGGYGKLIIGDANNDCSATDGDNEIVMALYIAWRQWGDDSGHKAANGEMISYKKELIDVTRGLVARYEERFKTENPRRCTTGDVGLDGYLKGGTTWAEVTGWATANPITMNGVVYEPEYKGPVKMHTDYAASGYYKEFYDLILELDVKESDEWEREQYRRCEASTDWIVHNWMSQNAKNIFWGEEASISENNVVTMDAGNQGGRFRGAWRTAMNYVWHGNPEYTWDPVTHTVKAGGNTYQKESCERISEFMNDPQGWDGSAACTKFGGGPSVSYKGPSTLHWDINPDGTFPKSEFTLNWQMATGMPSAIGAQDLDLAGILYRQCNIEWDCDDFGDGYLSSVPHYFHGFFRWLGMTIGTGNNIAPSQMATPKPNMKIYRSIKDSVTYAYTGDKIQYVLDYRNFGSVDAKNVVIVEHVPGDFVFVSASDGGVYNAASHTVTWNIGTVPGFKSDDSEGPALDLKAGNLAKTIGQVSYECRIGPDAFGRYCTTADITCSNGLGWTTNEYPNFITATMQRSCVDVIKRALKIEKTADRDKVNPGNIVNYKIAFENSSDAGWLDGGRPRVTVAMSNNLDGSQLWLRFRLYSDAIEPYINYGNYRIAYYMYDSGIDCLAGEKDCARGWQWNTSIYEGKRTETDKVTVTHETIVENSDDFGRWNQRLCIQFAPLLVTSTAHISNYMQPGRIHKGGTFPLRLAGYLNMSDWSSPDYKDDWSWNADAADAEDGNYHLISPSHQIIDPLTGQSVEQEITEYLPSICEKPSSLIKNILVEEYDGYVWRRILGTGPMAGREARNVVVIDTLPKGMEFQSFLNECPLEEYKASWDKYQIADGRWCVKWEIPVLQIKQKGTIEYSALASFPSGAECETPDELTQNVAWILADKDSPLSDTAEVTVTCAKVPKPIVPTTLEKLVDKESVMTGDQVVYTINYEQTHGSVTANAIDHPSEWTAVGASIKDGVLAVNQGQKAMFKPSKSENLYIEFDAKIVPYQEGEFIVRDDIRFQFKFDESNGMAVTCYDGTKIVKTATCALKNNPSRWKVKVQDDILQVWFGKDTSASAGFTAEGITVKTGMFGFQGVGYGNHEYSNIHIHTDVAYDLDIVDKIPAEIKVVSVEDGGVVQGDSIVWKFEHGNNKPIPFGKKYSVSWTGEVVSCNELIINEAYVSLAGHSSDEIRAQAVSNCVDDCEGVQSAEISIKDVTICEGDSTVIKAVGSPKSSKYEYEFLLDGKSLGKASSVDSFIAKKAGEYKVTITDPSCPASSAITSSSSVDLTVNALPTEKVKEEAICRNEDLKLGDVSVDGYTIEWFGDKNKTISVAAEDIPAEDVRTSYFYVLTDENTGCKGKLNEWEVMINDVPSEPTVKPEKELPLKEGVNENITNMASASGRDNYVVWYKDETAAVKDSVKAPIFVDLSTEGKVTYYVREKSPEGCIGAPVPVSVVVTSSQKVNANDTTICVGETIDVTTLVQPDGNNTIIWYDENGDEMSAPDPYSSTEAAEKVFTLAQKNDVGAVSEKSSFTVTVVEVAKLQDAEINYCAGDPAVKLSATVDASCATCKTPTSLNWYLKDQPTTELIPETNVTSTRMYDYSVEPVYEIARGHTCVGSVKASIQVNVEFVPAVMPDHAIHYTLSDLRGGKFPTLTEQDPTAVVPTMNTNKLIWYDVDGTELGETAPSPAAVTEDTELTYKVKQVSKNGCESALQEVSVIITKTPIPTTTIAYYCEGDTPDPITQFVQTTDASYTLVWFDDDPKKNPAAAILSSAPAINVSVDPNEVETIRKYYVAQENGSGRSSANAVEVHIFSNPKLVTRDSSSCGEPIDINGLWSDISKKVEFTTFYTAFGGTMAQDELVTKTGTYRVEGGFKVGVEPNTKECISVKAPIKIEIHSLGTPQILGNDSVCPNTAVELKVDLPDAEVYDSIPRYTWNKPNNSVVEGEFVSDPIRKNTTFSVTITDGICKKTYEKDVVISSGKIDGKIEISEADNENSPLVMNATADGAKFHSCGGDVTIVANVAGSNFVWADGTTGNTIIKKGGVYKLTYENGCETSFEVEIAPNPIVDRTAVFDSTLCEGENITLALDITAGLESPSIVWRKDNTEIGTDATLVLKKVTAAESGVYTYEATNRGCKANGSFGTLTVLPRPTYTIKEVNPVCAGETEEIGLESLTPTTANVEWEPSPTLTSTGITAVIAPTENETYSFTISQNGGCKIKENISVKVSQPIDFKITTNDTTICENSNGTLKFGVNVLSGVVLGYEWRDSNQDTLVSNSSVLRFNERKVGTYKYTVKLTSEACPSVVDDIEITIAGAPIIDTVVKVDYHNVEIVPNTSYGEAPYEYKIDANDYTDEEVAYVTYGHHTAIIKDKNGCMSEYEFVTEAPSFEIPTVVTPNGDGDNDAFISEVIAEAYPDARVTIYDRFGKKLTEIKGSESWDGTYNGHRMPTTDYWYEIWIEEIRKKYVGHFTLINE